MLLDLAISWGYTEADLAAGGIATAWVDPGVFALLGAGAFMGGVTRLTVSLAVIVMEMSGEQHFLLPILLGITVAKWTADFLHKPLYHALLEVKSAPFLPDEPAGAPGLHLHDVSEIMRPAPLTTLHASARASTHSVARSRRRLTRVSRRAPRGRRRRGVGRVGFPRTPPRVLLRAAASSEARRSRDADRGAGVNGGAGESRLNGRRVGYEELDRRADPRAPTAQMALVDDRKEMELSDLNLGARRSSRQDEGNGQFTLATPPAAVVRRRRGRSAGPAPVS